MRLSNITRFYPLIIFFISFLAGWALFVPGFYGASDDMHPAWLSQMDKVVKIGQFPPRFVPNLSYNFGYPLFNFVYPLPFYFAEVAHLLGLSFVDSIKSIFFLSIPLSGIFMFLFLKELTNKNLALTGAILYIFSPYRAVDLYIRGAIGEIFSFILLPLILLCIIKLTFNERFNFKWIGIGAISIAFLILSHNIVSYMFLPFVLILVLIKLIFSQNKKNILIKILITFILGILISIYFWLPALLDSNLMKYDTVFNFIDHFPTIKQLIIPFWGYGASVPGPNDGLSFNIGTINVLLTLFGLILLLKYWRYYLREKKIISLWVFISLIVTLFMMNHRSAFLWQSLPLITYFQFPWRFLIMTTILTPVIVIIFEKIKWGNYLAVIISALAIILNFSSFRPQDFLGREDSYYLNRYIPYPKESKEYKEIQEEYLRLPKDTTLRPDKSYPVIFPSEEGVKVVENNELNTTFDIATNKDLVINYNKYFFPGWMATLNGKRIDIKPSQPFGQISLQVPKGNHTLNIKFEETIFKKTLDIISLFAFVLSLILVWNYKKLIKR